MENFKNIFENQVITAADIDNNLKHIAKEAGVSVIDIIDYANKKDLTPKELKKKDYYDFVDEVKNFR